MIYTTRLQVLEPFEAKLFEQDREGVYAWLKKFIKDGVSYQNWDVNSVLARHIAKSISTPEWRDYLLELQTRFYEKVGLGDITPEIISEGIEESTSYVVQREAQRKTNATAAMENQKLLKRKNVFIDPDVVDAWFGDD